MNIHFILHSPIYTSKLIDWINNISNEENVFIEIASFRQLFIYQNNTKKEAGFIKTKRFLKQAKLHNVFYHYLSPQMVLLMRGISVNKSCWILWGADFYDLPQHRMDYIEQKNKVFYKPSIFADVVAKRFTIPFIKTLSGVAANEGDYQEINLKLKPTLKHYPLNSLFPLHLASKPLKKQGNKILVGNSNDLYNNHSLGLSYLNQSKASLNCILPISGAKDNYTNYLIQLSQSSLHSFQIIEDFISQEAFHELMQDVCTVVFPHYRQQGMGTIIPLIMNGRRIILSNKNPLFKLFKQWGLVINALEAYDLNNILTPLSLDEQTQNAKALAKALDKNTILEQWSHILATE